MERATRIELAWPAWKSGGELLVTLLTSRKSLSESDRQQPPFAVSN